MAGPCLGGPAWSRQENHSPAGPGVAFGGWPWAVSARRTGAWTWNLTLSALGLGGSQGMGSGSFWKEIRPAQQGHFRAFQASPIRLGPNPSSIPS